MFSLQGVYKISLILKITERGVIKNVSWSSCTVPAGCSCYNIKFDENSFSGSRVVPCGQTDRHDEANSRFSQFLKAPKKKGISTKFVQMFVSLENSAALT
jgi:hypothetical protein